MSSGGGSRARACLSARPRTLPGAAMPTITPPPMLTVIFSSFNGEATVGRLLAACCELDAPLGGWHLIAVDNGSTDRTGTIMRSFAERLPITVLNVARRGKNRALNEAITHARGTLFVFTDDDVIPDRRWLCAFDEAARAHPEYGLFGGAILPRWPRPPDAWLLADVPLGMVYAITDPALRDGEVGNGRVWGPNMAVRRSIFDQGARFCADVGPDGSRLYRMGSETEFTQRLARAGIKAWFCAQARVEHIIREQQLEADWILQRFFRHGRAVYASEKRGATGVATVFAVERWMYGVAIRSRLRALVFRLRNRRRDWFAAMREYHFTRGMIHQARQQRARSGGSGGGTGNA